MNKLIKITGINKGGEILENEDLQCWHLVDPVDGEFTFCDGFAYEDETTHEIKTTKRGGITCFKCLNRLEVIKSVKL